MPQVAVHRDFKIATDGIILQCKLSAPPGTSTTHIEKKITQLEGYVQSPDQVKLDFESSITLQNVVLVAGQPKTGDREYQFRIEVTGASMVERSTIFNLAQTGKPVTIKIVEQPDRKNKAENAADDKPATDTEATEATETTETPDEPPATESTDDGASGPAGGDKAEKINTLDECLSLAITFVDDDFENEQKNGATDDQIRARLAKAWADSPSGSSSEGFIYIVSGKRGKKPEPRIWIGETPQWQPAVNGKPALQGGALIHRVRDLMAIPKPGKSGNRTVH